MKKPILFLIICFSISFSGCEKNQVEVNKILLLKQELRLIVNSFVNGSVDIEPCNEENPYDAWGESLFIALTKTIDAKSKSGNGSFSSEDEFKHELRLRLPQKFSYLDTTNVNMNNIKILLDEFLNLYTSKSFFEVIQLSKTMEQHVWQSSHINESDKGYLLKLVSLFRFSTYYIFTYSNSIKGIAVMAPESFEHCWIRKLQAIEDSGFFEKLVCILDWPMCLGAIAADCLILML
jgi:hypothetical protein